MGLAKLRELPTLQAGARNGGPHPLQVSILLENLELHHSLAWDHFGEHRDLGKPRLGEGVVDELHLLQWRAEEISCHPYHAYLLGNLE
jgi:hypothetical protein